MGGPTLPMNSLQNRTMSTSGKPIDQAAIRELRADVLDGGAKEEADPGPQSQVWVTR